MYVVSLVQQSKSIQLEIIPILHNSGLLQLNFQNTKHSNKINISNCAPFNTVRECRRKAHRTMLLNEYKFKNPVCLVQMGFIVLLHIIQLVCMELY